MKISCQNCSSKYTVSDDKVQGKTVKLKCKKCGATILVNSSGATTVANGAAAPPGVADHASTDHSTDGASYTVNVAEGDQRTMSVAEIVQAYRTGTVTAETYIWADGMTDWLPIGQVEAIVAALHAPAPAAAPLPSSPPPAVAPSAEPLAAAAGLAASTRSAARRETTKRGDVFGEEKKDDVATSAPLFSASARAAASSAAATARPSQQREENSVLFSLNALTSKAATGTPAPAPPKRDSREDSGLIDLRALAASAQTSSAPAASSAASVLGGDDAGLFPLGMPPAGAPAAPPVTSQVSIPPPAANKTPMYVGIGALVAALAIVGVFFVMKDGGKPSDNPQTSVTAPATQPPPATTETPTQTATPTEAAPSTSATSTSTASVASTVKGPKGPVKGPSGPGTKTGPGPAPGPGPGPAPAPGPKKGNCGCAPSDLICNMKCSTK